MPLQSRHLMPDGLRYSINVIRRHPRVNSVTVRKRDFYHAIIDIDRKIPYSDLRIYVADVYILTVSDVCEIVDNYPDVNGVVVISNWDHYTNQAKKEARINQIGVFTLEEFLEALNYRGEEFLDCGIADKIE